MIYFTIYKTINDVNAKIYIGKHKTQNLNDGYLGSGIYLKRAIRKYGRSNFSKEILFIFDNELEMDLKESELVSLSFLSSSSNYNAKLGGEGGFSKEESQRGISVLLEKYTSDERSQRSKDNFHKTGLAKLTKEQIAENGRKGAKLADQQNRQPWSEGRKIAHADRMNQFYQENLKTIGKKMITKKIRKKRDPITYQTVSCPHCNHSGKENAMNRWHFDNCKPK